MSPRSSIRAGVNGRDSDDAGFPVRTTAMTELLSTSPTSRSEDNLERMAAACRVLLEGLGEDPEREGIVKTPMRMAKALLALTSGYALVSRRTASTTRAFTLHPPRTSIWSDFPVTFPSY